VSAPEPRRPTRLGWPAKHRPTPTALQSELIAFATGTLHVPPACASCASLELEYVAAPDAFWCAACGETTTGALAADAGQARARERLAAGLLVLDEGADG
jgi:hypothetical protein